MLAWGESAGSVTPAGDRRRMRPPRKGPAAACSLRRAWAPRAVRVAGSNTNEWVPAGEPLAPLGRRPEALFMPDPGSQSPQAAPGDRPVRDPSAGGSAMAPNEPDPAGAGPWPSAQRLLLRRRTGRRTSAVARQFLWPPPPRAPALDAVLPAAKLGRSGAPGERGAVQSPAARRAATGPRACTSLGPGPRGGRERPGTVADV